MTTEAPAVVNGNPRRLDTGNDYDRLQRYARVVTGYSAMITVAFAALGGFTWSLFPLKEIVPQFVYFSDKREQIVTVDARNVSKETRDILTEKLLRQYVTERETINNIDEKVRYMRLARLSEGKVWGAFRQRMDPENKTSPLRTYREAGMTREVHVETVTPSAYAQGIYTVDFVAVDRKGGDEIKRQVLVATIQVGFQPLALTPETVEENPIGLTVHGYEIRSRDLTQPTQEPTQ